MCGILDWYRNRPQYQIDKRSMAGHHGQRVMVRTCNGLELRDPSLFVETSASELVESSVLFPSLDSRDELHPRYVISFLREEFENHHNVVVVETLIHQGIGSGKLGKRVPYSWLPSGHSCSSTSTTDRGERGRSLQHPSSLASLPRIVQGHRRHPFHCRSYEKRRGLYQSI